jgi:integrase
VKAKPRGRKYRNLIPRGGVIQYERLWNGTRHRVSTKTSDWDEAAAFRDLWEETKAIGGVPFLAAFEAPRFDAFAARYLAEDIGHLATSSRTLRERELGADSAGGILQHFGSKRLEEITKRDIREWWAKYVDGRARSSKTGRNYLDALGGVLAYGRTLELIPDTHNPVDAFRETLRRKARTKRGRAEAEEGREVRPIESPADIASLLEAAGDEGARERAFALCLLDAGLRLGEARALRWDRILWGDASDAPRYLVIDLNIPTQGDEGAPKSGRSRRVALSKRLRDALFELYRERRGSRETDRVFPHLVTDQELKRWRRGEWLRIVQRAGIGPVNPKDLRDTFASQLLTVGVQLGYVSKQLGHVTVAVTAKHYARWCGGDEYRAALRCEPGEVPADLLSKLTPPVSPHTGSKNTGKSDAYWLAD